MTIRTLLIGLFVASLLVRVLSALPLQEAGYFDAFYYYHLALNMAEGHGLMESVIWNYLDQPESLPRPGNQYWMPLTNLLAWWGIVTWEGLVGHWRAAQMPFIMLGSLLPPLAAWLSWHEWQRRDWALGAGVLTLFSGFYFIYWVVPDNFTPFALTVALTLLAIWKGQTVGGSGWWVLAGVGAGLSHLARVDGALLAPFIGLLLVWRALRGPERGIGPFLRDGIAAAGGYLLLMGPWWLRNVLVVGTPFPGGGTQTLWLRSYNEFFSYEPTLTMARYLDWGAGAIIGSKLRGLLMGLLIMLGATQFFMAPFILGMVRDAARRPLFRPFLLYALLLLLTMTLIFTIPATRGSLLHSSAALIPWMMALVPPGIARAVGWLAARRRSWDAEQATQVLGGGFVTVAVLITLYIYAGAIWLEPGPKAVVARWNERTIPFPEVEDWLAAQAVSYDERIFVGDPPAYYVKTGRGALVIPSDGPEVLARAAQEWETRWLLLDRDNRGAYREMYESQQAEAGWIPVATFTDALGHPVILFRFDP